MQQAIATDVAEPEPRLVGYEAAAHRLGVPVGTLRSWVSRDKIPHYRLGKKLVRFDLAELDAWLETKRVRGVVA